MKTKHFFFWLAIAAMCITLFSTCKKDKEDYRDKWVGDWDFVVKYYLWDTVEGDLVCSDTIYYSGKINYENSQKQLYIQYMSTYSILVDVDESGKISKDDHPYWRDYTRGQFEGNDKIYIENGTKTLGSHTEYIVNGIKQKGSKK